MLVGVLLVSLFYKQTTYGNASIKAKRATKQTATAQVVKPVQPATQLPVVTTVFWAGEAGSSDNSNISNAPSAWDENWATNFGGTDDPDNRNGYAPAAFTPKENTFYFALPYSDFSESGTRKPTAKNCLNANQPKLKHYSWCKNTWIEITSGSGRLAYAQWEDVGPYLEDDANYVFGTAKPSNKVDARAGLDVSPAVRDYLKLKDVDKTSWKFIPADKVPSGPWKITVTTSLGDRLD